MMLILIAYDPTFEEWLILAAGVFVVLLVAFLFTKYTKYGGGSDYGITGEFDDDYIDYGDDID